jgi:hypothetical protein
LKGDPLAEPAFRIGPACFPFQESYSLVMSTILEIESAVQKLPLEQACALQEWLVDYLRESETSLGGVVADTWEKLGPPPEVDYDKI